MPKLTCPYCNKIGMSLLRKSYLGPAISIQCGECGKKIGVPYDKAMLAGAPSILYIVLSLSFDFNSYC